MKKDFKLLLMSVQSKKKDSFDELLLRYKPLMLKEAVIDGIFDEDLYQKYCIVFVCCVRKFSIDETKSKQQTHKQSQKLGLSAINDLDINM